MKTEHVLVVRLVSCEEKNARHLMTLLRRYFICFFIKMDTVIEIITLQRNWRHENSDGMESYGRRGRIERHDSPSV
jgi:hypothetical protein